MPSPLRKCIVTSPYGQIGTGSDQDYRYANNPQWFRDLNTNWIRLWADWPSIQPNNAWIDESSNNAALTSLDGQISAARANGLAVIVTMYRVPQWASGAGTINGQPDLFAWPGFWAGSPWEHWFRFLYRRYKPSNPGGPKVNVIELWNEPNMRYPQDSTTPRKVVDMFTRARTVSEEFDHELHIGGPGLADRADEDANGRFTPWADFHDGMKATGFRAHSKFIWTHHNYADVETVRLTSSDPANTNSTELARSRINSWWTGYDEGDGPILFATEGGGRLQYVGGSSDAERKDRQNRKTTGKFNALRGKQGIGMQSNYLLYDAFNSNTPLGYSGLRDPYPGGPRPVYSPWAGLAGGWGHVAGWGSEDIGPWLKWDCAVLSQHPGHVEVFAVGSDNAIWNNWQNWGPWSGWSKIGGGCSSGPGAISIRDGTMDLFVVGDSNQLWQKWWSSGGGWSEWHPRQGLCTYDPAVASFNDQHIQVFTRWIDGTLWHRWWWASGGWSQWHQLSSAQVAGSPSAVSWIDGRMDVVYRGPDNYVYHLFYNGAWNGPYRVRGGPGAVGNPEIVSWKPGHLDIFCGGSGGKLWRITWDREWTEWEPVANTGGYQYTPGAVSWGPGRIDMCFQRNNSMHHMWIG